MRDPFAPSGRDRPETLDMTPEGEFVAPPRNRLFFMYANEPWSARVLRAAVMVAALGGLIVVAGLALWLAVMMIPVVIAAGLIGYGAWRWRLWQTRRGR